MLPIYIVSKYNIRPLNGILFQWLNVSMRLSSSSESSDSSDSDSDTEKAKQKKTSDKSAQSSTSDKANFKTFLDNMIQHKMSVPAAKNAPTSSTKMKEEDTKAATGSTDLTDFVNNMLKARKLEKTIDVAMQPKKSISERVKPMSYEKKLINAAENVADKFGGDKTKTKSDLLQKLIQSESIAIKQAKKLQKNIGQTEVVTEKKNEQLTNINIKSEANIMEFIKSRRLEKSRQSHLEDGEQKSFTDKRHFEKKSIIHNLLQEYNNQRDKNITKEQTEGESISQQLLESAKLSGQQPQKFNMRKPSSQDLEIWNGIPSQIFENIGDVSPDIPELKTWAMLEQRELKALTTYPPANIFQEMILWTEQGKLWKFPIDNEQGMKDEHNIHFSEHVFTERHLKGWCPAAGPIRHFMELVCVGLSKNPYMTVEEKIDTIMWYKDYFKSKEVLLQEVGAIKEPFPDATKQITQ